MPFKPTACWSPRGIHWSADMCKFFCFRARLVVGWHCHQLSLTAFLRTCIPLSTTSAQFSPFVSGPLPFLCRSHFYLHCSQFHRLPLFSVSRSQSLHLTPSPFTYTLSTHQSRTLSASTLSPLTHALTAHAFSHRSRTLSPLTYHTWSHRSRLFLLTTLTATALTAQQSPLSLLPSSML